MRAVAIAVMLGILNSGCAGPAQPELPAPPSVFAPVEIDDTSGATVFLQPQWSVGRWWSVDISVDNFGFLQELRGRLVVTGANTSGFRVGADNPDIGTFDHYFDQFHIGPFDRGLNATVHGADIVLLPWPLVAGKQWTTSFAGRDDTTFEPRVVNATLTLAPFEDRDPARNLRIQGHTDNGMLLDYDYAADSGWMTYFRLTNKTTGRILLSIDYHATGTDYQGPAHHVRGAAAYERFVIGLPCDERGRCDPYLAGLPPAETVRIASDPDWVEQITFLFGFPIVVAAGETLVVVTRPDFSVAPFVHPGLGDQFTMRFNRTVVRAGFAGDWTVAMHAAGTAGAFVGLYRFDDDVVLL